MCKHLKLVAGLALAFAAITVPSASANASRIWHPAPRTAAWQIQFQGKLQLGIPASVYDVDGYATSAAQVKALHHRGRRAMCYMDMGSWESYRPDADDFPESVLGNRYEGYPQERWLDIRKLGILAPILGKRLEICRDKGFDAVQADNLSGYTNNTGFPLTGKDQLRFNRWVAGRAHRLGLAAGLTNDGLQARPLSQSFDFSVIESCFDFDECGIYSPFVDAGKAVFAIEYDIAPAEFCGPAEELRFSVIRKGPALDARPWEHC